MSAYISLYFIIIINLISSRVIVIQKIIFLILFIILFVFSGFIYEVGPDWAMYEQLYSLKLEYFEANMTEPFFILLSDIGRYYQFDKVFIQIIHSFLSLFFIYLSLEKINYHKFYMLFIYICMVDFYLLNLIGIRQGLAISIVFYALVLYVYNSKKLWAFFYLLLAVMVHYSAIILLICFPFFPLLKKKYSNSMYIFFLLLSLILYKINFLSFLTSFLIGRYESYSNGGLESNIFKILIYNSLFLFLLFSKIKNKNFNINFLFNYYFIGIVIVNIFASNTFLSRIWFYFEISLLILIPFLIFNQAKKMIRNFLFVGFSIYFSLMYIYAIYFNFGNTGYQNYIFMNLY